MLTTNFYDFHSTGIPVAACTLYKALCRWGVLEDAGKTNAFDRIVEHLQEASHIGSNHVSGGASTGEGGRVGG